MAVVRQDQSDSVDARTFGVAFAEILRSEPVVERLWVSEHRGQFRLWLLTKPLDGAGERHLHHLEGDLHDQFPEASFFLVILNPRYFEDLVPDETVPERSEEIALRVA
jgi:hypothetical protein